MEEEGEWREEGNEEEKEEEEEEEEEEEKKKKQEAEEEVGEEGLLTAFLLTALHGHSEEACPETSTS
jgi:hypothetical protein